MNFRPHPADFVAETNVEQGLPGILKKIDDRAGRSTKKEMSAIGQQVVLGRGADGGSEIGAEFLLQKANDFADALERKSASAELADHRHRDQFVPVVDAAMALVARRNNTALVPPLELAGGDAGKGDDIVGAELLLHLSPALPKQKLLIMFQTF